MVANWLAELDGRRIAVEVPATSANLGAGYDCLGLALDLTDRIEVEVRSWSRGQIELEIDGEGVNELTEDRDNRFVQGLETALVLLRGELPDGRRLADLDAQPDPADARSRVVGRGDGRRGRRGQRPGRRQPRPAGHAQDRRRDRGPSRQRRSRAARRVRRQRGDRRCRRGAPVRRPARPALRALRPGPPAPDDGDARRPPEEGSVRRRRPRTWRVSRSGSPGWPAGGRTSCAT